MKVDIEKCISCGRETGYSINYHVDNLMSFIEGSGQLCAECFKEVYNKVHKKDVDTDEKP